MTAQTEHEAALQDCNCCAELSSTASACRSACICERLQLAVAGTQEAEAEAGLCG